MTVGKGIGHMAAITSAAKEREGEGGEAHRKRHLAQGQVRLQQQGMGSRGGHQCCQMAKFDPFLSLDCARVGGVGAQSKERKGSNFAV